VREGCEGYVQQGIGLPIPAYAFHAVKLVLFVFGWMFFCSFTPGLGSPRHVGAWWFHDIAFQKAFLWACLVEVLGCGCMSGPLGFHLWPPFTAPLHFLRPGTIKLAPFPQLPLFGGTTRTWLDVTLYAGFVAALLRALVAAEVGPAQLVPIVVLLPLCGLGDKTVVLAARVEHHFAMIVCFLLAGDWIAGCKAVQLAIWFWAGVSKLTVAFGYVIPVMTVNNPLVRSASLRRRMFVSYPDDLRPSRLGKTMGLLARLPGCAPRVAVLQDLDDDVRDAQFDAAVVGLAHEVERLRRGVTVLTGRRRIAEPVHDLGAAAFQDGRAFRAHAEAKELPPAALLVEAALGLHHRLGGHELQNGALGELPARLAAFEDADRLAELARLGMEDAGAPYLRPFQQTLEVTLGGFEGLAPARERGHGQRQDE
jgi:hypothetical protein